MKILLIDDTTARLETVRDALTLSTINSSRKALEGADVIIPNNNIDEYCDKIIRLAKESINALYFYIFKIIEEYEIDIVFTDLSLRENSETGTTAGEHLIIKLMQNHLHKDLPIVAYSRHLADSSQFNNPYKLIGNGVRYIPLDADSDDPLLIRDAIFGEISEIAIESLVHKYNNRTFKYNIACLCALDKEFEPIENIICDSKEIIKNNRPYIYGYIKNKKTGIILKTIGRSMGDEYGKTEARAESDKILSTFKPKYITMTGIAGGHKENVNLGDVVIVRHTFDWEEVKYDDEILPRFNPQVTDKILKNIIKEFFLRKESNYLHDTILKNYSKEQEINKLISEVKQKDLKSKASKPHSGKLKYSFAPVATGSSVVNNTEKMDKIKSMQDKLGALDMEIFSLYASAYSEINNVKALAIKGIVDYGDGEKEKKWQEFASYASAQTLYKLFTEYIDVDKND